VVVDADDEEPQAARVTAATPRADQARARRAGVNRCLHEGSLPWRVDDGVDGVFMVIPRCRLLGAVGWWIDRFGLGLTGLFMDGPHSLRRASMGGSLAARPAG
jgi:hypothetical protein